QIPEDARRRALGAPSDDDVEHEEYEAPGDRREKEKDGREQERPPKARVLRGERAGEASSEGKDEQDDGLMRAPPFARAKEKEAQEEEQDCQRNAGDLAHEIGRSQVEDRIHRRRSVTQASARRCSREWRAAGPGRGHDQLDKL